MKWLSRVLVLFCLATSPVAPRVWSQEALGIKGDQESAGPTPIPRQGWENVPSAESQSDAAVTPKPKKKSGTASNVQEMSPAEFKRMGLDKLSPAELGTLNEWLKGYKHQAEAKAAAEATETTREQV